MRLETMLDLVDKDDRLILEAISWVVMPARRRVPSPWLVSGTSPSKRARLPPPDADDKSRPGCRLVKAPLPSLPRRSRTEPVRARSSGVTDSATAVRADLLAVATVPVVPWLASVKRVSADVRVHRRWLSMRSSTRKTEKRRRVPAPTWLASGPSGRYRVQAGSMSLVTTSCTMTHGSYPSSGSWTHPPLASIPARSMPSCWCERISGGREARATLMVIGTSTSALKKSVSLKDSAQRSPRV